jgi:hypothetical protein
MAEHEELFSFLQSEFETSAEYVSHVEDKLSNVVIFYSTLLFGVVSACSYIATADLFAKWHLPTMAPRTFFIGLAAGLFAAIGILQLGIYAELRVAKVRALEQMASVRSHFVARAKLVGVDIEQAVGTPAGVNVCPKFLERPSDDWYTLVFMSLVNALATAVYTGSVLFGVWPRWCGGHLIVLTVIGAFFLLFPAYTQFRWVTLHCLILDCQREVDYGPSTAPRTTVEDFAIPFTLCWIGPLAAKIERAHKDAIMEKLRAQRRRPTTAAGPHLPQEPD